MTSSNINQAKLAEIRKRFPSNVVVINSTADFAVQDATTITLEEGTTYVPGANLVTNKRFIVRSETAVTVSGRDAVVIAGTDPFIVWQYTGTDAMFSGVDFVLFFMDNFGFQATNATQVFDLKDVFKAFNSSFQMINTFGFAPNAGVVVSRKFGTFEDLSIILIDNATMAEGAGVGDGITLAGAGTDALVIDDLGILGMGPAGIALDLGTGVIKFECRVDNLTADGAVGAVGISGAASSANMGTGVIGTFKDNIFGSNLTPLVGISESDLRLEFKTSSPIPDSSKTVDTSLTASQTVTIGTAGVFVAIAGVNWVSEVIERFSTNTAGLATYLSPISTKAQVAITATLEKVGGGADEIQLAVCVNGVVSTKTISGTKNKDPTSVTSIGIFTLNTNDTIQAFVANIDSTANIIVSRCTVNIINGF